MTDVSRWLLGLGLAGLLLAALLLSVGDSAEDTAVPARPGVPPPAVEPAPKAESVPAPKAASAVLRKAPLSGGLQVDAAGGFLPTPRALAWMRSFLLAHRQLPEAEQEARLLEALRSALPKTAWADALDLARRTLAFRRAGREAFSQGSIAEGADLAQRLQWLRELRRAHYGPELAALLFREEEAALEMRLALRRVREDPDLAEDERAARLEGFLAELPERDRQRVERTTAHLQLARDAEELRAAGASQAEIYALRAEQLGADAAQRLAELDGERARWALRVETYRRERGVALARGATEQELDDLRAGHFDPEELERVRRLDAIAEQPPEP